MTRRECLALAMWAAVANCYAACARCWTTNPNRRKGERRG